MTSTWSRSCKISSSTLGGVAGLIATPTRFPDALMRCTVRERSLLPSQWTRNVSVPASTNSSMKKSGLKIIRCASSGRRVTLRSELTMGAPMERLGTKRPSITSMWMRSAPARSASATCSPRRAKSAARIEGASFTASFPIGVPFFCSCGTGMSFFKSVHKLAIAAGHLIHRGLPRRLLVAPVDKWLPEVGPTHGETDKAWHAGRRRQPFAHLFVVFSTPQDDAADFVATTLTHGRHNLRAVLAAVQPLDLPHVRLYLCVLKLLDALDHKSRAQLAIVGLLVALELFKLRLLRRYQQLEHKQTATFTMQVVRQPLQANRLPPV